MQLPRRAPPVADLVLVRPQSMSATLPEDIEADLRRDFARGIEHLRDGRSMRIGGLVLYKDAIARSFIVYCYSSKYYSDNITRAEAQERIATAKEELAILLRLFPELHLQTQGYELAFWFCHDDGKDAVCVAKEE